ncbi:hypothetical protein [Paraburkholderia oxyphila]|uniref:hypothetical protein n=1 Tax=Paraburkholderia oxyphila TaxID=614212 RepID=UPI0012ED1AD5|nr:hypothetical protein [Paraburkholderia oxyphila]
MSDEFAERDLAHIRNVLSHLEHPADSVRVMEKGPVDNLSDWRARVRTILVIPLLPMHMERQARDLPGHLVRLERPRRCAGASGDPASLFSAHQADGGQLQ